MSFGPSGENHPTVEPPRALGAGTTRPDPDRRGGTLHRVTEADGLVRDEPREPYAAGLRFVTRLSGFRLACFLLVRHATPRRLKDLSIASRAASAFSKGGVIDRRGIPLVIAHLRTAALASG